MKAIQKVRVEIVAPDQRKKAEQAEAYVAQLVDRRVAELMARQDLAVFQPFFESKKAETELRRLQTMPDRHKWRIYFETWGCLVCETREKCHASTGMCRTCRGRTKQRLDTIVKQLHEKGVRVEDLIDQERLAYEAYRQTARESNRLLPAAEVPKNKVGHPKMKSQIVPGDPGARVRQLRELAGLSQADLAAAVGVDRKTIISFERGDHQPIPAHSAAIRKALVESLVRAYWPD
jgi:putative transcriptional regulator